MGPGNHKGCGRLGKSPLSRIPQLNMSEGRTWSGEDTQVCCFKVLSAAWYNAVFL